MSEAKQTPLVDLLRAVPTDAHMIYEHSPTHSQCIPVGRLCHEAQAEIRVLRAQLAALASPPAPAQPTIDAAGRALLYAASRSVAVQLAGVPPCEVCGYIKGNCRCPRNDAPAQPASAEQATVQPTTLQNAIAWGRLYDRAQALCAEIGYAGSVSTDDDEVELLMDALHAIDGGEWMPGLLPAVAAPAPSAEQQPVANRDTPALHEAARLALDALALARPIMDDELAVNAAIDALRAAIGEGEGN